MPATSAGDGKGMLYQLYQAQADVMGPVSMLAGMAAQAIGRHLNVSSGSNVIRNLTAAYELISRAGLTHKRPPYGIDRVMSGNREVAVKEHAAHVTPFGT